MLVLATPTLPVFPNPTASFGGFPLSLELSRLSLGVVFALVVLFFAVLSIVLIYHWRRFPFDQEVFDRVEGIYFFVSTSLLIVSFIAIILTT